MPPTEPNDPTGYPTDETDVLPPRAKRRWPFVLVVIVAGLSAAYWHAQHRTPTPPAEMTFDNAPSTGPPPATFRVALLNMRRGEGLDGREDLDRTADTITGFDIVVLNEVGGATWTSPTNQADQLAAKLDMTGYFFPSQRRFYRDDNGNALLTRFPLTKWNRENLVHTHGDGHRHVVTCEVQVGGKKLTLVISHIDGQDDREAQMHAVFERFHDAGAPVIMAGDLNCRTATHPTLLDAVDRGALDALTKSLPEQDDWRRDWIFSRGLELVDGGLIDHGASDHPCYWAEFRFEE